MTLCIGDSAPDFTLPNQDGVDISLSSFQGSRVVIYFYPKDDTLDALRKLAVLEIIGSFSNQTIFKF